MNDSSIPSTRSPVSRTFAVALSCVLALAPVMIATARAADPLQPRADQAPAVPVTATFEKGVSTETGPYVLKLVNTSAAALTVNVKILLSVAFHADSKARVVPPHSIPAGGNWSVSGLAAGDKVVVSAQGFSPLELTVK